MGWGLQIQGQGAGARVFNKLLESLKLVLSVENI